MHTAALPPLTLDEIDDLLYFTRVNEAQDLEQTIAELAQKYQCTAKDVLAATVDPNTGNSVLHYCSANGFADLLPTLLAKIGKSEDASSTTTLINHANKEGNTPLHWAAYNGQLAIVKMLVDAGADMWVKNAAGHLAMFEAERADKNEVTQYLLEAGGKDVETGASEERPTAEDVSDVQNGEATGSGQAAQGEDVQMGEGSTNG